jgi:uncharacterized membrane protein
MAFNQARNGGDTFMTLLSGLSLGAAAMYIFDPDRGRRRRALARDKAITAFHELQEAADTTARDLFNRSRGVLFETWASIRPGEADDAVLEERVRAKLGRVVSHPASIEVTSSGGVVTLRGPILESEAEQLCDAVGRVRGVREVVDRLEKHKVAGDIPALQGGSGRPGERWELMQRNWAPATRFLVGGTGLLLTVQGLRRRGLLGWPMAIFGSSLLMRGGTNLETRRLAGIAGRRSVDVQKTIEINAPVEEVFRFWSNLENFPRFMQHVREVHKTADGGYRWVVAGPAGAPVSWNARITDLVPNRLLAWASEPGAVIGNAGLVKFQPTEEGGTRLHIQMSYRPPAGAVGHAVATLFGTDPKRAMDDDLARFKSLLEVGKTGAHGEHVRKEEVAI